MSVSSLFGPITKIPTKPAKATRPPAKKPPKVANPFGPVTRSAVTADKATLSPEAKQTQASAASKYVGALTQTFGS